MARALAPFSIFPPDERVNFFVKKSSGVVMRFPHTKDYRHLQVRKQKQAALDSHHFCLSPVTIHPRRPS
jgi:hypothetical protein